MATVAHFTAALRDSELLPDPEPAALAQLARRPLLDVDDTELALALGAPRWLARVPRFSVRETRLAALRRRDACSVASIRDERRLQAALRSQLRVLDLGGDDWGNLDGDNVCRGVFVAELVQTLPARSRRLQELLLARVGVCDDDARLLAAEGAKLPCLRVLDLSGNAELTDAGAAAVAAGLPQLRRLALRSCRVRHGAGLVAALPELADLDLAWNIGLRDAVATAAGAGPAMRVLDVSGRAVAEPGLVGVAAVRPRLFIVCEAPLQARVLRAKRTAKWRAWVRWRVVLWRLDAGDGPGDPGAGVARFLRRAPEAVFREVVWWL